MRKISVYHVDAFTDEPFGGNPAGVVPEASKLSTDEMQKLAKELNLSETAFLLPPQHQEADFQVRYFTPTNEIDFCGHATIGLSWVLAMKYDWFQRSDKVVLQTNIGLVPVEWSKEDNTLKAVIMTQVKPQVSEHCFDIDQIAPLIGIPKSAIDERYPIKLANTGNWHLLVPVKSQEAIDQAKPNLSDLKKMNQEFGVSTTHLFTFHTKEEGYDVYTRDFAPAVGIPEDPVTGSANGALAGYFVLEGILNPDQAHYLRVAQGHAMERPGTLLVSVSPSEDGPVIQVGGSAVILIEAIAYLSV